MGRKLDQIFVVDIESACWMGEPPAGQMNEIIEIGIAIIDVKKLKIIDKIDYIIQPKFSVISNFCTELTTITQEMVNKGITFNKACNKIQTELGTDSRIWASFGEYDKNHLKKICKVFNIKCPFSDMHWNVKSMASVFYGFPEMGMENLLNRLEIPMEGTHHRGVDDAYNTAKILIDILQRGRE